MLSGISNTEATKKAKTEIRLLNQMTKDLDNKEFQIYEKHKMQSQLIYNDKEGHLYNLVEHPEW